MLKRIQNIGIYPEMPSHLVNKIKVFNSANLFILLINVFYIIQSLVKELHLATLLSLYSILSILIALYFVYRGKFYFGFHFILVYAILFITSFSLLFGLNTNTYLYFIFAPVAVIIMFDNAKTIFAYTILITLVAVITYYIQRTYSISYYDETIIKEMNAFGYTNFLFIIILIFLGVYQFKLLNKKYSEKVESQKYSLQEKNKEITDSIHYAGNIQKALLPKETEFKNVCSDYFLFFQPKDIVSGDFYWIHEKENLIIWATGDCTGHGVPGGFMTMLGLSFLDEIAINNNFKGTSEILNQLREKIISALKQNAKFGDSKDGMDLSLCIINRSRNELCFSGANNGLIILRNNEIIELTADKQPCGFFEKQNPFTEQKIKIEKNDWIISYTDGFADQFGGAKGKKVKYRKMLEVVQSNSSKEGEKIKENLKTFFNDWKGSLEQVDDVCIMGLKF